MDWDRESWIKLYTRDSLTWLSWPWETRAVFLLLLRKVERDGTLNTEGHQPHEAVSLMTGVPGDVVRGALGDMEKTGTVRLSGDVVTLVNFAAAQQARTSDAERKRRQRNRDCHTESHDVTARHTESHDVTACHAESQRVTNRREEKRKEEKRREEKRPGAALSPKQRDYANALASELERAGVPSPLISDSLSAPDPILALKGLKAAMPEILADKERENEAARIARQARELAESRVPDEERAKPEAFGEIVKRLARKT